MLQKFNKIEKITTLSENEILWYLWNGIKESIDLQEQLLEIAVQRNQDNKIIDYTSKILELEEKSKEIELLIYSDEQ